MTADNSTEPLIFESGSVDEDIIDEVIDEDIIENLTKEPEYPMKLSFNSMYDFECAAKRLLAREFEEICGPQLNELLKKNAFVPHSANDFVILGTYEKLNIAKSTKQLLPVPVTQQKQNRFSQPNWFNNANLAHASDDAVNKLISVQVEKDKRIDEIEIRRKERLKKKKEKEEKEK